MKKAIHSVTRAMLLFQYVVLVAAAFYESRMLGYQLRNDGYYPMGCTGIDISSTLFDLLVLGAGITVVLGVLAHRSWKRSPYIVLLAVETLVAWDVVVSPYFDVDLPTILFLAMYASSIVVTIFLFTSIAVRPVPGSHSV